jgi:integrase
MCGVHEDTKVNRNRLRLVAQRQGYRLYSDRFHALVKDAGLPRIRLHSVRHTLAMIMHRAGVAPADAAALLGHTLAVHLSTYIPASERGARSAAAALGSAISRAV